MKLGRFDIIGVALAAFFVVLSAAIGVAYKIVVPSSYTPVWYGVLIALAIAVSKPLYGFCLTAFAERGQYLIAALAAVVAAGFMVASGVTAYVFMAGAIEPKTIVDVVFLAVFVVLVEVLSTFGLTVAWAIIRSSSKLATA